MRNTQCHLHAPRGWSRAATEQIISSARDSTCGECFQYLLYGKSFGFLAYRRRGTIYYMCHKLGKCSLRYGIKIQKSDRRVRHAQFCPNLSRSHMKYADGADKHPAAWPLRRRTV